MFTPKPSLIVTEVSIGTLPSLCMHDVMVVCGEFMANQQPEPEGVLGSNTYMCVANDKEK